jgi:hypothetical protein
MSHHLFLSVFGTNFDNFIVLPANGMRGGVLIAWKGCSCQAVATRLEIIQFQSCLWNKRVVIGGSLAFMGHKEMMRRCCFCKN